MFHPNVATRHLYTMDPDLGFGHMTNCCEQPKLRHETQMLMAEEILIGYPLDC